MASIGDPSVDAAAKAAREKLNSIPGLTQTAQGADATMLNQLARDKAGTMPAPGGSENLGGQKKT